MQYGVFFEMYQTQCPVHELDGSYPSLGTNNWSERAVAAPMKANPLTTSLCCFAEAPNRCCGGNGSDSIFVIFKPIVLPGRSWVIAMINDQMKHATSIHCVLVAQRNTRRIAGGTIRATHFSA